MASKINTTYWGTNVSPYNDGTYTYSWGISTNNIRALLQNNKYDPNTDSFDYSVSPWGIGYSAAGNRGQIAIQRQGSVDGNAPGVITKISFEGIDRENTNRPFYIPTRGTGGMRDNYNWIMSRVGGDCNINNDYYLIDKYNGQILAGNSTSSDCISNQYACTFLNYQHFKLAITAFNYINLDTGVISQYSFLQNNVTPEDRKTNFNNYNFPEHMAITTIYVRPQGYAMQVGSPTQWTTLPTPGIYGLMQMRGHTIGDDYLFNKIGLSAGADDKYKLFAGWNLGAYGVHDTLNSYYTLPRNYYTSTPYVRNIPVKDTDYRPAPNGINYSLVQVDGLGVGADSNYSATFVSNYCDKEQSFADIKYSQRPLLYRQDNGFTEIKEGYPLQTEYNQFRATSIYEVTDSDTFTKAQILALIKHEVAFYGFEFFIQWGNSYGGTWSVGDDDLFMPVFDEHLITTGRYVSGTAALTLPSASWGNVFDDNMPEYDAEYNPAPTPQGNDENDGGFLNNSTYRGVKLAGSNEFYAMNVSELRSLMTFINGMYQGDADDTQLKIDFKGSNPNDYIVGIYAYPFNIPNTAHLSNIYIGPVETNVNANVVDKDNFGFATFGSILVDGESLGFHGDFRDYEPYTQLELYLPMVGTAKLDPSYYVGHLLTVNYIYDINTGSLSAQILRDDTIDKIIESTLSVQIPVTARDMGSYQNNIYQMKMNLLNTAVHGAASGITQTATAATKGTDINGVTNAAVSGFEYGQQFGKTIYDMKHMQPAIAQTSTASPANGMQFYNNCVLFVKHLKMLDDFDPENYGKTVGYACLMNKQLSEVSGFTVCANADLSGIPATADEINAIQAALQSGIYL